MQQLIHKITGTYADALEAIGAASLLEDLGFSSIMVKDEGPYFTVQSKQDLHPHQWQPPSVGYPYIWERSKEPQKPPVDYLDYEDAKQKRDALRKFEEAQKRSRGKLKSALEAQDIEPPPGPPPSFSTASILASMRKGWNADRDFAKWVKSHPAQFMRWVQFSLGAVAEAPNESPTFTNSQVLNPIAGKGVSAPKAALRSPGSVPGELVDPFKEWMKLRGLWRAMLPYRVDDDFKFFVLEPADIAVDGIALIKEKLAGLNLWGDVRLDIEATLRCAELLIGHSEVGQSAESSFVFLRHRTPRSVIAGLRLAYFKSLGTAAALMNDAFLPLPDWFQIENRDDANDYLDIIEETIGSAHVHPRTWGCLGSLDDRNSDDGRILQQYRQWLLTENLSELLEFHSQFAVHLMTRLGSKMRARPFSTAILDKLFTKTFDRGYYVKEIIEDPGFRSVARAIRNSTVYAISLPNSNREIHFGLAQKWKQKMRAGSNEFASELSQFVQEQNWEVIHRLKGRGHVITTSDIDAVIRLIEDARFGSELVGSLLLAYGYARAPKVEGDSIQPAEAITTVEK